MAARRVYEKGVKKRKQQLYFYVRALGAQLANENQTGKLLGYTLLHSQTLRPLPHPCDSDQRKQVEIKILYDEIVQSTNLSGLQEFGPTLERRKGPIDKFLNNYSATSDIINVPNNSLLERFLEVLDNVEGNFEQEIKRLGLRIDEGLRERGPIKGSSGSICISDYDLVYRVISGLGGKRRK